MVVVVVFVVFIVIVGIVVLILMGNRLIYVFIINGNVFLLFYGILIIVNVDCLVVIFVLRVC